MDVIFDSYIFEAKKDGDDFTINGSKLNEKEINYLKEWMDRVANGSLGTPYKRNGFFMGPFMKGTLIGCFPIRMTPDTITITCDNYDR